MIAQVVVNIENKGVDKVFDYSCFDDVKLGSIVLVPFGKNQIKGFVVNLKTETDVPTDKLKSITKVLNNSIITDEFLQLSSFMAKKYNLKMIDTLKLFIPSGILNNKVKEVLVKFAKLNDKNINLIKKTAKKQQQIVEYLQHKLTEKLSVLNQKFGASAVKKLIELDVLIVYDVQKKRVPKFAQVQDKNITLTPTQQNVIDKIINANNQTFLLHGVTGSGKTEVYMNVIQNAINNGKNAIMLVPEISLTPQVMQNFVSRFGNKVAIIHSGLSIGERFDEWERIKNGDANIVVGARSAIFAPLENIGVIIIDEEHDTSYYSESNPRYFTHDIAKFRCNYNNANLILGSATPSVEDYFKAQTGEYSLLEMPIRVNHEEMPQIKIVDMMSELLNGNNSMFSSQMIEELEKTINSGKQAIIFLNRRGYNSFVRCQDCGYVAKCEDCDVSLVYHKQDNQLKCHYCGKRYKMLTVCPNCKSKHIKYGAIGTQKVVEELQKIFPNTKIFRMDNDTTTTKNSHENILQQFGNTQSSILVGTQMIAKGHDFPLVTFVGIIDADVSLHFADFRATERAFSLITQVSGRAGRSKDKGVVVLQTYMPKHYVYRYASDYNYNHFFEREINLRKVTNFPPFSLIVRILISGEAEQNVKQTSKQIFDSMLQIKEQNVDNFIYLGAMKSPVKKIEKKYRYQILTRLTVTNSQQILDKIYTVINQIKTNNVSVFVELNPQNLS